MSGGVDDGGDGFTKGLTIMMITRDDFFPYPLLCTRITVHVHVPYSSSVASCRTVVTGTFALLTLK